MPCALMNIVIAFAELFSKPVFAHAKVLLSGALLAVQRRTVTEALRVMGVGTDQHFQNYHRVLNRAEWSAMAASRILLRLLISAFAASGVVVVGLDETIERRWGKKIKARGIYRDAVRSSHSQAVKCSGLRWLSVMLLAAVPFAGRVWGLPFLTVLCPSERYDRERGRAHQSLAERAKRLLLLTKRWLPDRKVVAVGDQSFAVLEFLTAVREQIVVVTRLRLDAALYEPAPERTSHTLGRPRKKGVRLATLQASAESAETVWQRLTVLNWYGESEREVEIVSATCVWFHVGKEPVPIRYVLIRDPLGKFKTQALLSTDLEAAPKDILGWFVRRWQMEVTFEESRRHLGVETNRQWSEKAIKRTTPCLFGLFSLVALCAAGLAEQQKLRLRKAAWYEKQAVTFSDAIAAVRRLIWSQESFQTSVSETEMIKIPRPLFERLMDTLCYAT
jgi:hypothetical protein